MAATFREILGATQFSTFRQHRPNHDTGYRMLQDPDSLGQDITESALRSGLLWKNARMLLSVDESQDPTQPSDVHDKREVIE
jgi:hypothetical protein